MTENLTRVPDTVYGVIDKFNIPTRGCVLAHVTTQIEATVEVARRADLICYLRQR